jgi:hypothetical protein
MVYYREAANRLIFLAHKILIRFSNQPPVNWNQQHEARSVKSSVDPLQCVQAMRTNRVLVLVRRRAKRTWTDYTLDSVKCVCVIICVHFEKPVDSEQDHHPVGPAMLLWFSNCDSLTHLSPTFTAVPPSAPPRKMPAIFVPEAPARYEPMDRGTEACTRRSTLG